VAPVVEGATVVVAVLSGRYVSACSIGRSEGLTHDKTSCSSGIREESFSGGRGSNCTHLILSATRNRRGISPSMV